MTSERPELIIQKNLELLSIPTPIHNKQLTLSPPHYRPDFWWPLPHNIILEIDEFEHSRKTFEEEFIRMNKIIELLSKPVTIIRLSTPPIATPEFLKHLLEPHFSRTTRKNVEIYYINYNSSFPKKIEMTFEEPLPTPLPLPAPLPLPLPTILQLKSDAFTSSSLLEYHTQNLSNILQSFKFISSPLRLDLLPQPQILADLPLQSIIFDTPPIFPLKGKIYIRGPWTPEEIKIIKKYFLSNHLI